MTRLRTDVEDQARRGSTAQPGDTDGRTAFGPCFWLLVPGVLTLTAIGLAMSTPPSAVDVRAEIHPGFGRRALERPMPVATASAVDEVPEAKVKGQAKGMAIQPEEHVHPSIIQIERGFVAIDPPDEKLTVSQTTSVAIRSGTHPDFKRLVLEWKQPVTIHSVERDKSTLTVLISRNDRIDLKDLVARFPDRLKGAAQQVLGPVTELILHLEPGTSAEVKQFEPHQMVIDLASPKPTLKPLDAAAAAAADGTTPGLRSGSLPTGDANGELVALLRAQASAIERLSREVAALKSEDSAAGSTAVAGFQGRGRTNFGLLERELAATTGGQASPAPPSEADDSGSDAASTTSEDTPAPADDDSESDPELQALNRVLVEAGGLLLPMGGFEVSPSIKYTHRGADGLIITDVDGVRRVASQNVKRDDLDFALTLRAGLPWDSQVDLTLPYMIKDEKVSVGGVQTEENGGSGFGDLELAFSHQFARETKYLPDLIGEVAWRAPTGKDSFEVDGDELATGSGFHGISGTINMTKSYDPLVFFGSLSYTGNLPDEKNGVDINPGDQIGLAGGAILAAGPGTSLRAGISQSFTSETEINGQSIAGSDQVSSMLQIGASAALPARALLDISAGVGITEDAPDLTLRAALPYRF